MSVAIALDILVAGLLVATIAYAIVLNRRLSQLRGGREQMERLINDFYQATTRAESGLSALKDATERDDSTLIGQLESLTKVRDELDFLVARAEAQSARLEEQIGAGRGRAKSSPAGPSDAIAPDADLDAELFAGAATRDESGERPHQPSRRPSGWKLPAQEELQ